MPLMTEKPFINIVQPKNGLYIHGIRIIPLLGQIVIGEIDIIVETSKNIQQAEFQIFSQHKRTPMGTYIDSSIPFMWNQDTQFQELSDLVGNGFIQIIVKGYDTSGKVATDKATFLQIQG
jgi:hypothetical protein